MADSGIKSDKSSIDILDGECHELVAQALRSTLSTQIAQSTLAQILLRALQAQPLGSDFFNVRLIEFIAVGVHEVAKYLYKLDSKGHQDDGIETWVPPKNEDWDWWWRRYPDGPPPTLFYHTYYFDHEQYPDGAADMVGYWAESRILGGVIVFDRKRELATNAVFIHPDRDEVTYRICELTGEQKTSLVRFLIAPPLETGRDSLQCPLPIIPGTENTNRIDPEEPISWTGIYRDAWERNLHTEELGDGRRRDVWRKASELDWLTFDAWMEARGRYYSRLERYPELFP
ncbi:hypothetical protein DHEL01_v211516 [Diaporthe helianthi]|uniref:Uncharacterized protein n=1 Tax=Diaporthe helianthi TaxID=158607 RepID=A0A2P5HIM4_DIAHE|nr:hypothetical protein DHEL01_v211516 [Diaporthe helianthi]